MRKQYKDKKRSCGLCKPHKRKWANRWSHKEHEQLIRHENEIKNGSVVE